MGRPKNAVVARRRNLELARRTETEEEQRQEPVYRQPTNPFIPHISGKLLAYAILIEGGQYAQIADILTHCGLHVVSSSAFHSAQRIVRKHLEQMGLESIAHWRLEMKDGTVICIDGCWDHKRTGKHCVITVIDNMNWKIVDVEIIKRGKEIGGSVNFVGPAPNMESEGIRRILSRFVENDEIKSKICAYCHDCDARVRNIFEEFEWYIHEFLDINHAMLSFQRSFEKINGQNSKCLEGLYFRLKLWIYHIISMDADQETKVAALLNAANHYTGDHSHCDHDPDIIDFTNKLIDDEGTYDVLVQLLQENKYIVEQCNPIANTQHNESFNNTRARMATKSIAWNSSFRARTMVAVLETNEFNRDWKSELRERLGIPELPPSLQHHFDVQMQEKLNRSMYRHTEEYKKAERLRRQVIKRKYQDFNKTSPEYNLEHVPGWINSELTFQFIESLEEGPFKRFITTQKFLKDNNLKKFTEAFVNYEEFKDHKEYMKSFILVCRNVFDADVKTIFDIYDVCYVNYLENLSLDKNALAEKLSEAWDLPNLITESAQRQWRSSQKKIRLPLLQESRSCNEHN